MLKNASYNPRTITKEARRRLKNSLKSQGLVQPLVWNEATGNLVGGHQRVSVLDDLEKTQDYLLTVAVINVSEAQEKKLNILLNNPLIGGEFDPDKFDAMIPDLNFDIESIGFDRIDISAIVGTETLAGIFAMENEGAEDSITDIKAIKDRKKEAKKEGAAIDDAEFYVCLVFKDRENLDGFLNEIGESTAHRFIDGHRFAQNLGIEFKPLARQG